MAKEIIELEVKSDIGDAAKDAGKLTKNLKGAKKQTDGLTKASKKSAGGFKGLGRAVKGLGTALKAIGIGLIIAAVAKLGEVFGQNQKVVDTFNTAMTAVSIAFNDFFKYLDKNIGTIVGYLKNLFTDPIGELYKLGQAIQMYFVDNLKDTVKFIKAVAHLMTVLSNPRQFVLAYAKVVAAGIAATKELSTKFKEITGVVTEYTSSIWETSKGITALTKAASLAGVEFAKLNAIYLRDAEIQRQIRDDVSKTFAVRIKANEDLGKILEKQQKLQKATIQTQIAAAQAQVDINDNVENRIALGEAENAMLELQETIEGQRSEQKTNQVGLEEELRDAQAQTLAESLSGIERELAELKNAYDEKVRLAEKAGMKTAAITKKYEKQKKAIVQAGVDTQIEAYAGLAGAVSSLAGDNKQLAAAEALISTYLAINKIMASSLPYPANIVAAIAAGVQGFANVQKIFSVDVGEGGGGSAPSDTGTPAPQMVGGKFELGSFDTQDPIQAYVVTDDMTNNQDKLANIRRRATI